MSKSTKQRKQSFPERNGSVDTTDAMILGEVPKVVANAISSVLCRVFQNFNQISGCCLAKSVIKV